jgi:hypothetical protein
MNGLPGVDIVFDGLGGRGFTIQRIIVARNRRFSVSAAGMERGGKDSPSLRRYLDSFKLLPAAR